MIGFVERLPTEWESKWESMQARSSHDLVVEGKHGGSLWNPLPITLEDCAISKLERKFAETVRDARLTPLLRVIQGLMRFLPSSRIAADETLHLFQHSRIIDEFDLLDE